jgi:hypothetical protein
MNAIYQRLKEMDADTFQRFCFHVLKERHPELELKHVDGKSGDEGLDIFTGELYGKPSIWQCKSFPDGVRKSQKAQIKESLRIALEHFSPAFWILCLSIDMDVKARRWFENLKKSYEAKVRISDLSASEIVNEVIHRRSLRNQFFPNAAIDPVELKRLVTKTGEMSTEELERITDANVEDVIERLKERDARFNYQIVFDGDLGPPTSNNYPLQPGLVMSVRTEGKTVNVFARDPASLRANPPKFHTTFKGEGVKKYQAFLKTGVPQDFEAGELASFETDMVLMNAVAKDSSPYKLRIAPSPVFTNKKVSVRVEFVGNNGQSIRYDAMHLSPVRGGVEELEFCLSGKNVPFSINIVLLLPGPDARLTLHFDGTQKNPKLIKKSLDALNLLRLSGTLRIFELETEKTLVDSQCSLPDETPQQAGRRAFVDDVVGISERFATDLKMPDQISEEDLQTIFLLKQCMTQGTLDLDNISTVIQKTKENENLLHQFTDGKMSFGFVNEHLKPTPVLFGTEIQTGPVVMQGDAEINDYLATVKHFDEAAIGTEIRLSLKPLSPVRLSLASPETERLGLKLDSDGKPSLLIKK